MRAAPRLRRLLDPSERPRLVTWGRQHVVVVTDDRVLIVPHRAAAPPIRVSCDSIRDVRILAGTRSAAQLVICHADMTVVTLGAGDAAAVVAALAGHVDPAGYAVPLSGTVLRSPDPSCAVADPVQLVVATTGIVVENRRGAHVFVPWTAHAGAIHQTDDQRLSLRFGSPGQTWHVDLPGGTEVLALLEPAPLRVFARSTSEPSSTTVNAASATAASPPPVRSGASSAPTARTDRWSAAAVLAAVLAAVTLLLYSDVGWFAGLAGAYALADIRRSVPPARGTVAAWTGIAAFVLMLLVSMGDAANRHT